MSSRLLTGSWMTDRLPLHNYARSRAVVMGTWDYDFLEPVPAVENSMRRMAGLLTGPLCGWPREQVLMLANEPSPGDLPDRLITAFDGISDIAVFYYVGHGQISPDDQLCLGLVQSRKEANRRAATSLRFSDVRQALQDSGATTKIVILDCCFAGLATVSSLAGHAGHVLDLVGGTGAYTMAATNAYATAWYEDSPRLAWPQTYFTKYLVDLIEEGIPGQPSQLRLDPLFKTLRDSLAADQRPVPHKRAVNDARDFVFAYNAAPPQTHRDPEREVAQLTQRLAESDAEIQALKAEAAERTTELARLKNLMASARPRTVEQRRELQDRIDQATRELDDAQAALPQADQRRTHTAGHFISPAYTVPVTAEWALWGRKQDGTPGLVECSDGSIGQQAFKAALTPYSPGILRRSPQVTISWLSENYHDFIAVAIHERTEDLLDRSGAAITQTRYFCVPYPELADGNVSYQAMYDVFRGIRLPITGRRPIEIRLAAGDPMTRVEDSAMAAAAMLMTGSAVKIGGADQLDIEKRLQFIDSVASFLPYGIRTRFSASTWVDNTYHHKFRLFFANATSQHPGGLALTWDRPPARQ